MDGTGDAGHRPAPPLTNQLRHVRGVSGAWRPRMRGTARIRHHGGVGEPVQSGVEAVGALSVLAFVAEVGMLVGLSVAGWHLTDQPAMSLLLAILLPSTAGVVWGLWCAPRAPRRLGRLPRWAVKVTLFSVTFALLMGVAPQPWPFYGLGLWLLFLATLPADRTR